MTIAVDFDGTIVYDRYPLIGPERPFATQTLRMLAEEGHLLILWTCREGKEQEEAINWCKERGVEFYAVNKDFPEEDSEKNKVFTRKIKADVFIDDRNIGGLIDWGTIYEIISKGKTFEQIIGERLAEPEPEPIKKPWWAFFAN